MKYDSHIALKTDLWTQGINAYLPAEYPKNQENNMDRQTDKGTFKVENTIKYVTFTHTLSHKYTMTHMIGVVVYRLCVVGIY